jgi:hypothetical protein
MIAVSDSRTPPPPPRNNARRHQRFELMASVEVHKGDETLILPARNLSLGGIYLANDGNDLTPFKVGTSVEILVFNAADETHPPVKAGASVVRHDMGGIALKWHEDADASLKLASLLEAIKSKPDAKPEHKPSKPEHKPKKRA